MHDYWAESLFSGEPYFEKGVLSYFDGRVVTICGFPLRGCPLIENGDLHELIHSWIRKNGVEAILVVGPRRLDLRCLRRYGFRQTHSAGGRDTSCELLIDCTGAPNTVLDHTFYRRSVKTGLKSRVKCGSIVSVEYLKLIELFFDQNDLTDYLAQLICVLPVLLRSRRVWLIEARENGRLCGFATLHKAFSDIAVGLFLAHDRRTSYVSDFLYGEALMHANKLGVHYVNVGASPSFGLYSFKRKWGGEPLVPPYFLVQWTRGRLVRRTYASWCPRVIRL